VSGERCWGRGCDVLLDDVMGGLASHAADCPVNRPAPTRPAPIMGDGSDKEISLATAKRIHGWTVEQWIDYVRRNPDCTVPGGVACAIVTRLTPPAPSDRYRAALAWHEGGRLAASNAQSVQHVDALLERWRPLDLA
jgi:hypothetical protein